MPEQLDIGALPVAGAFFVRSPPVGIFSAAANENAVVHPERPTGGDVAARLVWTHRHEGSTLKEALLAMIRGARRKVFIASFRIGDDDLFAELFDAVERLKGSVYVITLLDDASLAKGIAEAEDDDGADDQALRKRFHPLVERGIYVRGHDGCHAKFVVVDDEVAMISSANLESRAFETTTEIGVVLREKGEVERIARLFARLWHECTWEVAPGGAYTVAKRQKSEASFASIPRPVERQRVLWTHGSVHFILNAAREAIRGADAELLLASYSLTGMSENRDMILTEVERFRKLKGGPVRLLLRARNHVLSQRRDAAEFAALGCDVFADEVNHAKCVIADRRDVVLFSANFDAKHGLTSGVEAGIRLAEPRLVQWAAGFFEGLLRAAPMRLLVSPSHRDLQMLVAAWNHPWPNGPLVRVQASDADWKAFISLEAGSPVLFEQGTDGRLVLVAGHHVFFFSQSTGGGPARIERTRGARVESSAVLESWLSARTPSPGVRGVCSAQFVRA